MPTKGWQNEILICGGINMSLDRSSGSDLGTDGYLLIGNTTGYAQGALPTSSDGSLTITGGAGTLDLTTTIAGITWNVIIASQALVNNNGYICGTGGGAISLSLPSSAAVGDIIEVSLSGATSWTITQGAGQTCRVAANETTTGVGGSIASSAQGDSIRLVCDISGVHWTALSSIGLLTVT